MGCHAMERRYFLRCASVEEAPPVPAEEEGGGGVSENELDVEVDVDELGPCMSLASKWPRTVPDMIEVTGCCARAAYPALSPRSGMLKRKDGDHLGINGVYTLREVPHNGAPCWVQRPWEGCTEAWHIFRSLDGTSWVIDSELHTAGCEDAVAARLNSDVQDPTASPCCWVPIAALKLQPIQAECRPSQKANTGYAPAPTSGAV
mmetsp:Transcript_14628/g.34715  ORF Transcript_14628/g.34715 Transcript_14628/m.34715 type:complete len:204 (-) Transcript_14628:204-815(-)